MDRSTLAASKPPDKQTGPRRGDVRPFIGKNHIGKQLNRLSHLPRFPTTDEGVADLVVALGSACWDDDHVTKVVDELVYACRRGMQAPTAGDLRAVARNTAPPEAGKSWACERCDSTGWRRVERGGMTGVEPCDCHPARGAA